MIANGTRLGPYEIVEAIGAGGMGEVYRGLDTRLDRSVAIKVLPSHLSSDPAFKLRFEREARTISGLNHPNICTLHDIGSDSDVDYLVMELCDGTTLADRLDKGPLPIDQTLRYAIQIAGALDRAHRSGIVHRDLKPANVMLTRSGAKLLDFGLAKPAAGLTVVEGATEHRPLTQEGVILGTFQYMAPEQLEGKDADNRSDIFAFGAMLYEMVSGKRAFEGSSRASLIAAILDRDPQPLSNLQPMTPKALERVISICLAKDPDDRWQSAHDLERELQWIRDGASTPSAQPVPAGRRSRREGLAWSLAAVLPILAVAITWFSSRETRPPVPRIVSQIAPPPGTSVVITGDAAGPVTLSPDGRHAIFVARSEKGQGLFLKSLETGEARLLPGTGQAMFPFWSPDSRSIAFFAGGRLMITDVLGAQPRAIASAPDARGGAWGPDDQILYAPFTQSPILRVSARGGETTPITQLTAPHSTHRWPEFLPDGRGFIYLAASHQAPTGLDTAIYLASLDGGQARKLLPLLGNAVPYGDFLLYLQTNRLVAQRLVKGELQGEPIVVWENVLYDTGTWKSVFSVSRTGLLTFQPAFTRMGHRMVWVDRGGKELGELGQPGALGDLSLSPDGRSVALTDGDPKGVIYLQDRRGVRTRFSFTEGSAFLPIWTPDGRNIVFGMGSGTRYQILIRPADGSAPERKLLESNALVAPTSFTPDGGLLIYSTEEASGALNGDIGVVPLAGGKSRILIGGPGQQYDGMVSPDGKWLIYVSHDGGERAVFLTPFGGGGGKWQVSNETAYMTWWNPNGSEILYVGSEGVNAVPVSLTGGSVQLGTPALLFRATLNTNQRRPLAMSPDGQRFLVILEGPQEASAATLVTNFARDLK